MLVIDYKIKLSSRQWWTALKITIQCNWKPHFKFKKKLRQKPFSQLTRYSRLLTRQTQWPRNWVYDTDSCWKKKDLSFFWHCISKSQSRCMVDSQCIKVIQTVKIQCLSNWENVTAFSPIKITNWRKNHFSDRPRCFKHGIYSVHFACRYAHRRVSSGIVHRPGMTWAREPQVSLDAQGYLMKKTQKSG